MNCFTCRDQGMPGGCPSCGKTREFSGNPSVALTEDAQKAINIPQYYWDQEWNAETLKASLPELKNHRTFSQYVAQLDKVYNVFRQGMLPNRSALIVAPPRRGKLIWAFSCMKQAMKHGYKVVPLLDTSEWRRLNIIATERAYIKDMSLYGCTMEDVVSADIVFLTVDKDNFKGAYRAIESLLDKRQRRGRPTLVISRYSPEQISILDYDGDFRQAFDKTNQLNPMKYLGLIEGE